MKWNVGLVIFLVLAGCASKTGFVDGDQAPAGIKKPLRRVDSPATCRSQKGHWFFVANKAVFPNGGYCQFRTHDGGKSCRSTRDCEGYCELSFEEPQDKSKPRCSSQMPPRWDRCVPGYFENGKVLGRGECFGDEVEIQ